MVVRSFLSSRAIVGGIVLGVLFIGATAPQARGLALPTIVSGTAGTQAPGIIYKADQLLPFLQAAASRRVDIAGIGDSNQVFGGDYGHDHGSQLAWSNKFGMYATEVLPSSGQGGYIRLGVNYEAGTPYLSDQFDPGLPAQYADLSLDPKASGAPASAGYLAAGATVQNGATMYVSANAPFYKTTDRLQWTSTYYAFPGSAGDITPQVRGNGGATGVYQYDPIQTYPTITIPAGPLGTKVDVKQMIDPSVWTRGAGDWKLFLYDHEASIQGGVHSGAQNGQLYTVWQRMENVDRTRGIAYSTLLYQGGKSARDAALSLQAASDPSVSEWMRQATRLQNVANDKAMMLVQIQHGGNDRNAQPLSVGPHPAPSNSPAGFKDNIQAIIDRMRQVWSASGYDVHNLFFTVGPYHPQAGFESQLAGFESSSMALADSTFNVTVVRGSKLITARTMTADLYYTSSADNAHLSQAGYETIGRLALQQLTSAADTDLTGRSSVSSLSFTLGDAALSFDPREIVLKNLTNGSTVATADLSFDYNAANSVLTFTFPGLPGAVLPVGQYEAKFQSVTQPGGINRTGPIISQPYTYRFNAVQAQLPEPASAALILGGVGALVMRRGNRARKTR